MILQRASNRRLVKLSRKVFAREISSPKEPTWSQRSKWAPRSGQTWIADLVQDANNSGAEKSRIQEETISRRVPHRTILDFLVLEFLAPELLLPRQVGHSRQQRPRCVIGEVENSRRVKRQMMADGQLGHAVHHRPREKSEPTRVFG